jgi:hypothetical protein
MFRRTAEPLHANTAIALAHRNFAARPRDGGCRRAATLRESFNAFRAMHSLRDTNR